MVSTEIAKLLEEKGRLEMQLQLLEEAPDAAEPSLIMRFLYRIPSPWEFLRARSVWNQLKR